MTQEQLEEYLGFRIRQLSAVADMQPVEVQSLIRHAIELGLSDFWHSGDWSFRERQHTLTLSAMANTYDLPDDFEAIVSITDQVTGAGWHLLYLAPDVFRDRHPDPITYGSGYPQVFTIFDDEGTRKISFYPPPASGSLLLNMHTKAPNNVGAIPARATAALVACIEKYIVPVGSSARAAAEANAANEIVKLENRDTFYAGQETIMKDSTDLSTVPWRPWV